MKLNPLFFASALLVSVPAFSNAATVVVANQDYNMQAFFITNGANQNFTFDGGGGNTITLKVIATNQAGEVFSDLDRGALQTGGHIAVGPAGAGDNSHMDSSEDVTFTVSYVSHTGTVDASTLAFRFDKIGFRGLQGGGNNISWTVNGGSPTISSVANATDLYRNLDTTFTTIGTSGAYSGVFENQATVGQLSTLPTAPTAGNGTRGLQFSVQFDTIPEPSVALLGGLGALALLRRRRL